MEDSKIEWTKTLLPDGTLFKGYTFNYWIGCTEVSPACDNCYARELAKRFGLANWGHGEPRRLSSEKYRRDPFSWNKQAAKLGYALKVFCSSLSDIFDSEVPDEWRADLFSIIENTPNLRWLLLTKRPQNIDKMLPAPAPKNVWFGTTVENQKFAELRLPHLVARTDVPVRFVSIEPQVGDIDMRPWVGPDKVNWVIGGGESGKLSEIRPYRYDWAASLIDVAREAGVPCFIKQMGAVGIDFDGNKVTYKHDKGGDMLEWPERLRVREYPPTESLTLIAA